MAGGTESVTHVLNQRFLRRVPQGVYFSLLTSECLPMNRHLRPAVGRVPSHGVASPALQTPSHFHAPSARSFNPKEIDSVLRDPS